jgi:hypothetical protein
MEWTQVETQIVEDDRNKWDRTASANTLSMAEHGFLQLNGGDGEPDRFALSELATAQMCQRLGIPVRYYRRLPHELQAAVANHDFGRLSDNAYFLRGKDEWVRAFLSVEYVAYSNGHIAETVKELLQNSVTVKSFVLDETHLYLKVIADDIIDPSSGLKAGVMIGNSEVGLGSVSVEPFVYRLTCTNDLVVSKQQSFRHPHTRLSLDELRKSTALAISIAFKVANGVLDAFLKTRQEPIGDPVETICRLAEERKLSLKFTDQVISSYAAEPEPTRFGVINAFTRAAQKLAPLQRIEIERFAGSLIEAKL